MNKRSTIVLFLYHPAFCFWDMGTTTVSGTPVEEGGPRQAVFQWQMTQFNYLQFWIPSWDWVDLHYRRRLCATAGFSIYFTNLGVGTILNRRTLLSSANFFEPWKDVEKDIRVWALGRGGSYKTPFRYRVWRVRRLIPRSNNAEHWHGARGGHVPRHDLTIVHTLDQMYLFPYLSRRYHYAYRAFLYNKRWTLTGPDKEDMFFSGSGFTDMVHIKQNFNIRYHRVRRDEVVDCSKYLPKWWGKFICFRSNANNVRRIAGVPSGGGLFTFELYIMAVGCFEIRYNEDRILVFTDLRYYLDHVHVFANISLGEYYEYAYQMWGSQIGYMVDGGGNAPFLPYKWIRDDYYPLGK